jgi:hypothetical protein
MIRTLTATVQPFAEEDRDHYIDVKDVDTDSSGCLWITFTDGSFVVYSSGMWTKVDVARGES